MKVVPFPRQAVKPFSSRYQAMFKMNSEKSVGWGAHLGGSFKCGFSFIFTIVLKSGVFI